MMANEAHIEYQFAYDPEAFSSDELNCPRTFLNIDKPKLHQVLRNLVSNAIKFTSGMNESSVKRVVIYTSILGETLKIQVCDTGPGISGANQLRLFKDIVQFNPNELQKGGGSGLGLYISRGIVDLHGGRIGVHSDGEGKGSCFTLEIPCLPSEPVESEFLVANIDALVEDVTMTSPRKGSADLISADFQLLSMLKVASRRIALVDFHKLSRELSDYSFPQFIVSTGLTPLAKSAINRSSSNGRNNDSEVSISGGTNYDSMIHIPYRIILTFS
jgi:hypothetical protein